MIQGAHFSPDRNYRYALWRIWDPAMPLVMFIGLNPSKANEYTNDPTIRRVTKFAADWGYGGMYMMNLFGWVTPYPQDLRLAKDPVGENDSHLKRIADLCAMIIYVWGSFPQATERAKVVLEAFPGGYCLGHSKMGNPLHPLYLPGDTKPIPYICPEQ